jgi:hypothetical protein
MSYSLILALRTFNLQAQPSWLLHQLQFDNGSRGTHIKVTILFENLQEVDNLSYKGTGSLSYMQGIYNSAPTKAISLLNSAGMTFTKSRPQYNTWLPSRECFLKQLFKLNAHHHIRIPRREGQWWRSWRWRHRRFKNNPKFHFGCASVPHI